MPRQVSYQFFVQPGSSDKYWSKNGANNVGTKGFAEKSYDSNTNRFAPDGSVQYNCKIEPVDGLPSGSPFWSSPPEQVKGWGSFGKDVNFLLNCTQQSEDGLNPPGGPVDWANIVKEIGGYNNVPTAGKVRSPPFQRGHCFMRLTVTSSFLGFTAGTHQSRGHSDGQQFVFVDDCHAECNLWERSSGIWDDGTASVDAGTIPIVFEFG